MIGKRWVLPILICVVTVSVAGFWMQNPNSLNLPSEPEGDSTDSHPTNVSYPEGASPTGIDFRKLEKPKPSDLWSTTEFYYSEHEFRDGTWMNHSGRLYGRNDSTYDTDEAVIRYANSSGIFYKVKNWSAYTTDRVDTSTFYVDEQSNVAYKWSPFSDSVREYNGLRYMIALEDNIRTHANEFTWEATGTKMYHGETVIVYEVTGVNTNESGLGAYRFQGEQVSQTRPPTGRLLLDADSGAVYALEFSVRETFKGDPFYVDVTMNVSPSSYNYSAPNWTTIARNQSHPDKYYQVGVNVTNPSEHNGIRFQVLGGDDFDHKYTAFKLIAPNGTTYTLNDSETRFYEPSPYRRPYFIVLNDSGPHAVSPEQDTFTASEGTYRDLSGWTLKAVHTKRNRTLFKVPVPADGDSAQNQFMFFNATVERAENGSVVVTPTLVDSVSRYRVVYDNGSSNVSVVGRYASAPITLDTVPENTPLVIQVLSEYQASRELEKQQWIPVDTYKLNESE